MFLLFQQFQTAMVKVLYSCMRLHDPATVRDMFRQAAAVWSRQPVSLNILFEFWIQYLIFPYLSTTPLETGAHHAPYGKLPDGRWIPAPWAVTPPRFSPSRPSAEVSSSLLRIIAICGVPPRVSVSPVSLWCKCTVVACPGSSALIHLEKEGRYLVNVYSVFKVPVGTFVHDH